ncbi:MAG: hypothetical protein A3G33_10250 [Omnitrophica bacterium RIFCSPLOWO2_12_FULL_44_17]|uniref:Uncharacterized protein n=1 Tax=Candidatus Danuiimicrobium aquiferis TaxID=1801832 RepID=A0A1G1L2U5_9BACT|nr:MAG: hypothetical protein A3B72_08360 [Omnitrophica bacterium RIFCSPHIGHO2_02_FULL_45_28]OGW91270.1 MAG: hypothetical protein A3E74_09870 [Omnitrophica bacterium RIFCSPHIGHO2_12_FULL_44_12]OGW99199.1 MAG: hypothetical protein A3G33_10250 [Omnitrophica bacterium RIFCSPLOWO2_12_FULL_44_17]OGX04385.1 MAG: hypothetical protein A3J12_00360 [Omnitrophica bacterium RIFCSPLOWO2_02_FULL_44_11]
MHSNDPKDTNGCGDNHMYIFLFDEDDLASVIRRKQDEFLDIYSLFIRTKLPLVKEDLLEKAYELSVLDPKFTFHV